MITSATSGPGGLSPFTRLRVARLRFAYAGEDLELDRDEPSAERALWAFRAPPPQRARAALDTSAPPPCGPLAASSS